MWDPADGSSSLSKHMDPLPCDGTPVLMLWEVLGFYLLAYGLLPQARLTVLALLGPAVAVAQIALLRPGEPCAHAVGFGLLSGLFTWFLNPIALFLGVIGCICGATALAGLTHDPDSVLIAAAGLALVTTIVYVKTEFEVWERVLPVWLGAYLLVASFGPMAGATTLQGLAAFVSLCAIGGAGQWYGMKSAEPDIIQDVSQHGEFNRRFPLISAIQKAGAEKIEVNIGAIRDAPGVLPPKPGAHPQEILSRPEDDPRLSEDDKKIIAICREYPDEMERVVFGGGMY